MAKMLQELQEVQDIVKKEPVRRTREFLETRTDANKLIRLSGQNIDHIAKSIGMSRQSLHRRLNDPSAWEPDELLKLFKHLGVKS